MRHLVLPVLTAMPFTSTFTSLTQNLLLSLPQGEQNIL